MVYKKNDWFTHNTSWNIKSKIKELSYYIQKTGNCHGLTKIRKSKKIKIELETQKSEYAEISNTRDLKFRPIVAAPSCLTYRLRKVN